MRFIKHDILISVLLVFLGSAFVASHCGHHSSTSFAKDPKTAECPICKMQIVVTADTPRYEFKGKTYYFMNEEMKSEFVQKTERTAKTEKSDVKM